jgi:hypothetical protein
MVSRAAWGAKAPKTTTKLTWPEVDALAIHYTAAFSDEFPDYKARVRGIQRYHQVTQEWSDIAYNYLVSRTGDKFVGRGWGVMSAATLSHNDHTQAICFLGSDKVGRDDVTDKGRKAISELIFEAENLSGKRVGQVHVTHGARGTLAVGGHRDFVQTDCPGDELYHFISLRGWDAYRPKPKLPYPAKFFQWAAWYLGEGSYAKYGPKKGPRPKVPMPLTPVYWTALKRFLAARGN